MAWYSFFGASKKQEVEQPVESGDFVVEVGASGVKNYGGQIYDEEQNPRLSNGEFYDIISQYYRTDSTLSSGFKWLTSPIYLASWDFKYPRGATPNEEILSYCRRIWQKADRGLQDTLRSAVAYLLYGNMPLEIVFKIDPKDGAVWLSKLSPRKPNSMNRYVFDSDGNLEAYVQVCASKDGSSASQEYVIPADKLVFLRNDDFFGNNYEGCSVARSAYRSLKHKDELLNSLRAMLHRFGSPIPVFSEPENESLKTKAIQQRNNTAVKDMAYQLRSGQYSYAVLPAGWQMNFAQPDTGASGFDAAIRYHDQSILSCMGAQLLGMGSSITSTQGLGKTFENIGGFGPAVIAKYIGDSFDKQLFKKLIDLNFGEQEVYPQFVASNLKHNPAEILPFVTSALQGGGMTKTAETEAWVRDLAQAPGITNEEFEKLNSATDEKQERRRSLRELLNPQRSQREQSAQPSNESE